MLRISAAFAQQADSDKDAPIVGQRVISLGVPCTLPADRRTLRPIAHLGDGHAARLRGHVGSDAHHPANHDGTGYGRHRHQRDRGGLLDRVRRCANPECGWLFLDDSRAGKRRWCSMSSCGNRARARRHYHKGEEG
jgi:hypothetical protein